MRKEILDTLYPNRVHEPYTIARRHFLKISAVAGGGLLLSTRVFSKADVQSEDTDFLANAFVKIEKDNTTTITIAKSEMGQGVRTSLALLIAEELDLDWKAVKIKQAVNNPKKYGRQGTGGSGSVRDNWLPLRESAGKLRQVLLQAASKIFNQSVNNLKTENGKVIDSKGNSLSYGELAKDAAKLIPPDTVTLKSAKDFKLIGKEHTGVDVDDIVCGKAKYGIDSAPENCVYAVVARTPEFGATIDSFDATECKKVKGVLKVFQIQAVAAPVNTKHGVVVIANNTWSAMQGKSLLKINWKSGNHASESSEDYRKTMLENVSKPGIELVNKQGDPDAVLKSSQSVISATYEVPFIAHSTMEPMNCTALFDGENIKIWAPTQFPNWAASSVAGATRVSEDKIELYVTLMGGGFGRRINPDVVTEAALIAKELPNQAVQVFWSREDDIQNDFYRPPAVHRFDATLDQDGNPHAFRHRLSTPAINATLGPALNAGRGEADGTANMLYRCPNRSSEYTMLISGVYRGWWRAVHTTHGTFALECFMDELAEKAGEDELDYRLNLIDEYTMEYPAQSEKFPIQNERLKGVLKEVEKISNWKNPKLPKGHAYGVACAIDHLSYCAEVVEVSIEKDQPVIHNVYVAVDCGPVVNPNGARAQLEGGVHQALSVALGEKITIKDGKVQQSNFHDYQLLRINQAPKNIKISFVQTDTHPTGLGEPSVPPLAPALANALYKLTGQRIRTLPINLG